MSCEVCEAKGYRCYSCEVKQLEAKAWDSLPVKEKVIAVAYKRLILSDRKPDKNLINAVSNIYDKYPDFHIGIVP
jgi:endonuclease III